jgi:hypothetical protein
MVHHTPCKHARPRTTVPAGAGDHLHHAHQAQSSSGADGAPCRLARPAARRHSPKLDTEQAAGCHAAPAPPPPGTPASTHLLELHVRVGRRRLAPRRRPLCHAERAELPQDALAVVVNVKGAAVLLVVQDGVDALAPGGHAHLQPGRTGGGGVRVSHQLRDTPSVLLVLMAAAQWPGGECCGACCHHLPCLTCRSDCTCWAAAAARSASMCDLQAAQKHTQQPFAWHGGCPLVEPGRQQAGGRQAAGRQGAGRQPAASAAQCTCTAPHTTACPGRVHRPARRPPASSQRRPCRAPCPLPPPPPGRQQALQPGHKPKRSAPHVRVTRWLQLGG